MYMAGLLPVIQVWPPLTIFIFNHKKQYHMSTRTRSITVKAIIYIGAAAVLAGSYYAYIVNLPK